MKREKSRFWRARMPYVLTSRKTLITLLISWRNYAWSWRKRTNGRTLKNYLMSIVFVRIVAIHDTELQTVLKPHTVTQIAKNARKKAQWSIFCVRKPFTVAKRFKKTTKHIFVHHGKHGKGSPSHSKKFWRRASSKKVGSAAMDVNKISNPSILE